MNTSLYLIPKGKNGFFYEPEIEEVLLKYGSLKVDLSDPKTQKLLAKEIGERIREIPFDTVAIDECPSRSLNKMSADPIVFNDGSKMTTMHNPKDV